MTKEYTFKISTDDKPYMLILFVIFIIYCLYGFDYGEQIKNNETSLISIGSLLFGGAFALSPRLIKLQKIGQEIEEFMCLAEDATEKVTATVQQATTSVQKGDIAGAVNTVSNAVPVVQKEVQQATQIAQQTVQNVNEVIQQK